MILEKSRFEAFSDKIWDMPLITANVQYAAVKINLSL